jgi:hypothetical protein
MLVIVAVLTFSVLMVGVFGLGHRLVVLRAATKSQRRQQRQSRRE